MTNRILYEATCSCDSGLLPETLKVYVVAENEEDAREKAFRGIHGQDCDSVIALDALASTTAGAFGVELLVV